MSEPDADSKSNISSQISEAVAERDVASLRTVLLGHEFVLISVSDGTDDEENVGALTAELEGFDVLVAFTSESRAGEFVGEMDELFEDNEEVEGVVVEGDAMLEYLPEGYGILVDPEADGACVIEPTLASEVIGDSDSDADTAE